MSPARRCRLCASPLAQDNTDALCSACQDRHPRGLAPEVPAEFWHSALIGAALASRDLGRVIRMYRSHPSHRRPLHQCVVADWLYVSPATLSRIERGQRQLTIEETDSFTRALGIPLALRWTAHPSEEEEAVDPINRRSLLGAGVGAALTGFGATTPAAAGEIDPGLVSHWIKLLHLFDRHDAMFGPHEVFAAVRREIDIMARHRQVARGALRNDLLRVEARWSEFASWLGRDAGDARVAGYCADRALSLAQEAGYQDMTACVLVRRSQWAVAGLDAQRALTFAEAAGRTPGASDQVRALSTLQEAQGHALAGDAAACQRALADVHAVLDGADAAQPLDMASNWIIPSRYVEATEARCWLWLQPNRAVAMYDDVLDRWPGDRTRSRGVHQARLALASAAAGEPERAATEGLKALSTARATKSAVTARELKRLDHQLAASDLPAAADFREALAAL